MKPYLIGIAGPSCSGKTSLAAHLASRLNAALLSLDSYYRPLDHLNPEQRAQHNFDSPESIDSDLLLDHLRRLLLGHSVQIPIYEFATHTRTPQSIALTPQPYLIVEGLFALHWEELRASLGTRIYVHLEEELCLARRIERDMRERGRTRESILRQFQATVAPMARQHVYPSRLHADLVVYGNTQGLSTSGESDFSRQVDAILRHVFSAAERRDTEREL